MIRLICLVASLAPLMAHAGTCSAPNVPRAVVVSEAYLVCPKEGTCWRQTMPDGKFGYQVRVECLAPEQNEQAEARGR